MSKNWGLKILAFFIACMIWFYVSGEKGADIARRRKKDRVIRNVVVNVVHPSSFVLQTELNPKLVNVKIRGAAYIIDKLTTRSILVFVDVTDLSKGKYVLQVQIKLPVDVKLVQITPPTANVVFKK